MKEYLTNNWKTIGLVICGILFLLMFYKVCIQPNNTNVTVNVVNDCCCCGDNHYYNETIPPRPPHAIKNEKATGCPLDQTQNIILALTLSLGFAGFTLYKRGKINQS